MNSRWPASLRLRRPLGTSAATCARMPCAWRPPPLKRSFDKIMSVSWPLKLAALSFFGAWASRLRCLCTVQRWTSTCGHSDGYRRLQAPERHLLSPAQFAASDPPGWSCEAASLSPPMFLIANSASCPSARTPSATGASPRRAPVEPDPYDRAVEDQPHDPRT